MNSFWAMEPGALLRYRKFKARFTGVDSSQLELYQKKLQSPDSNDLTIVDGVAVIPIRGSLSNRLSFFSFLYDGELNTYPSIIHMINSAVANPLVSQIQLRVDSPGGRLDGLFDLMNAIKAASKPVEALIEGLADSAAYGIVSQADKIIAASNMSEVGSIGVGTSFWVDDEMVDITSSDAPNKWPDVTTAEGVNVVKGELDEIHLKFVEAVAEGRSAATGKSVTVADVNLKYGQGGTMLAEAGQAAGMVDEIISAPDRVSNADFFQNNTGPGPSGSRSGKSKREKKMDVNELKEKYPEVHAAAIKAERNRAAALLKAGQSCGKLDYAIDCVADGSSIGDDLVQAEFLTARINKADVDERKKDDPPAIKTPEANADKLDEEKIEKEFLEKRKKRRNV